MQRTGQQVKERNRFDMGKVILREHIQVPARDLEAVEAELEDHIRPTRAEEGCLVFEVGQDQDDPYRFTVYEEFSDQTSFDHHKARLKTSKWGQVAARL